MVVQHNITAMNANRYFGINNNKLSKSLEKLSSGYAINRAGDNAAGLAVSEKMRSQIAGMTQGVKNAQDGISMIQTFEGALTETDNILQRMKTLADQAAHGTYQDEVDREAIQLEFDQLNDELNQIADTDFNGVVMLNGGQMADGLKAVNGKFDYANYVRDPMNLSSRDVTVVDHLVFDDVTGGLQADAFWTGLNSEWKRDDEPTANDGPESVELTFEYDATGGDDGTKFWKAVGASNGVDIDNVEVESTKNGGFKVSADGTEGATVVLDSTGLVSGDKITLKFNNPKAGKAFPTNAGAEIVSSTLTQGIETAAIKPDDVNLEVNLNADALTDKDMTEAMNELYEVLNGAQLEVNYTSKTAWKESDFVLKFTDKSGAEITMNTPAKGDKGTLTLTAKDGTQYKFATSFDDTTGSIKIGTAKEDGSIDKELIELKISTNGLHTDASDTKGKITFKIGIENNAYDSTAKPNVEVKDPVDMSVSESNTFKNATAPLTYTDHLIMQVGARSKDAVDFTFKYSSDGLGKLKANMDCSAREGGLNTASLSLLNAEDANAAIDQIDNAINKVSMVRATFGATQNRLEHKIDNMNVTIENLTSAESRIRDTNMAEEMMNFTKQQILSQASQSMLAQANQLPQSVLQLLQ